MTNLEKEFDIDMHNIYKRTKEECNYNATRFLQMLNQYGGLATAKKLIHKTDSSYSFTVLWENNRLDLSVEALVINPKYHSLFTEEEIKSCENRLSKLGYHI